MPLYELGYREWKGETTPRGGRWWALAQTNISLAWKNRWLRRLILFAWIPTLYFGLGFFAYENLVTRTADQPKLARSWGLRFLTRSVKLPPELLRRVSDDPAAARPYVWSYLMLTFFRAPQLLWLVVMMGLLAPPLISRDVRSRAFLLYFSHPITRTEYLLGKATSIWIYLALISTLPALMLYLVALFLSPSFAVFADTWTLPFRILGASVVLLLPTTLLGLAFSSLTVESRYAAFAWFAVWALGWVAYASLSQLGGSWDLLSLYHLLGKLQSWVFGIELTLSQALPALLIVSALTVISFLVLFRRISSPIRI